MPFGVGVIPMIKRETNMSRTNTRPAVATLALLAALGGVAFAAQDRYSLQVPGGLAFSEFKGYEEWQVMSISHNGDKLALIVGNPAMMWCKRTEPLYTDKPVPAAARMAKTHGVVKNPEAQPGEPIVPGALHD